MHRMNKAGIFQDRSRNASAFSHYSLLHAAEAVALTISSRSVWLLRGRFLKRRFHSAAKIHHPVGGAAMISRRLAAIGRIVLFLSCVFSPMLQAHAQQSLSSPAIDTSLFREGEVKRVQGQYGHWGVVCDVIPKLNHRFCSLTTQALAKDGRKMADVIFSTGDDGRPATLIHVPYGVFATPGITIELEVPHPTAPARKGQKAAPATSVKATANLPIWRCGAGSCDTVWNLPPEVINKLRSGGNIGIHYQLAAFPNGRVSIGTTPQHVTVDGDIFGDGFNDALMASQK